MLQLLYLLAVSATTVFGQIGGQAGQGITGNPRHGPEAWFYNDPICTGTDYSTSFQIENYENGNCYEKTKERISLWVARDPDPQADPIMGCLYAFNSAGCPGEALSSVKLNLTSWDEAKADEWRSIDHCFNLWGEKHEQYSHYKVSTQPCGNGSLPVMVTDKG